MTHEQLKELLDSLTLEQKIGQLFQVPASAYDDEGVSTGIDWLPWLDEEIIKDCGSAINIYGNEKLRSIQKKHLENNPIPLIFMGDIINGYHVNFPASIAQGCSFNPEYAKKAARIAGSEAAKHGISVTFSPMVDVARDARWGRCSEGYGESALLNSDFARANVIGYQGDSLSSDDTIAACVKHFVAYGAPEDGRDYYGCEMSERKLRETYLPSFKAAIDAGARLLMPSFNAINGEFCTLSKKLLVDVLRKEWGFSGTVVSDFGAIEGCYDGGAANSMEDVAALAVEAQVNIDMSDSSYPLYLKSAIEKGLVTMEQLDQMVMNVLELKNECGILDNPYKYMETDSSMQDFDTFSFKDFAVDFVCQSSVLLKNEGAFPISKDESVAFIGPYLEQDELTTAWGRVTPYRYKGINIKQALKGAFYGCDYDFAQGCDLVEKNEPTENDEQLIKQAVELAKTKQRVVLFIGEHFLMHGECRSRVDITIPHAQKRLFDEIYKVNKNISIVLFSGRPLVLTDIEPKVNGILHMWFPGSFGSDAIASMLAGNDVPSGKLCMTFPRTVGQVPTYHEQLRATHETQYGRIADPFCTRYHDCPVDPLYPFGYGLSYTTFNYSDVTLSSNTMTKDEKIIASVDVTNTGETDAYETVLLFIGDIQATLVTRPLKQLKSYEKVFIKKGETKTVQFEITEEMLRFYNHKMQYESEPGEFLVNVAKDSATDNSQTFTLV